MKTLSDEILNKYLDGDLNKVESAELEDILAVSKDARLKLNAMRQADSLLKNLPLSELRSDFTNDVMNRIQWIIRSKHEQKNFIIIVSAVFILLCLGIAAVAGIEILHNLNPGSSKVVMNVVSYTKNITEGIQTILSNRNITIVGGLFSFGLIISAYFFFDYSKMLRKARK